MRSLLMVALVASGCGPVELAPKAGEPCSNTTFTCQDTTTRLLCDQGIWVEYPCNGTYPDTQTAQVITGSCNTRSPELCVAPKPAAGDLCPVSSEGQFGRCVDTSAQAKCVNGKWFACPCDQRVRNCTEHHDGTVGLQVDCPPSDHLCWQI